MDTFLLFGMIGFGLLILGLLGYSATTNKIIREQEKEIADLEIEVKRLKKSINEKRIDIALKKWKG